MRLEPQAACTDLLVLHVLPTAVRCREIGGGLLTYRCKLPALVPGQRLTIVPTKRWLYRRTQMIGGELVHVDFTLRGLQQAGYARTRHVDGHLVSPGDDNPRLREAIVEYEVGHPIMSRYLLLEVLADEPGNLLAHATLGEIQHRLGQSELAMAHFTAAIRLGLGSLVHEGALPLDPQRETERVLIRSLLSRSRILARSGRVDAAAADLRRALAWDPTDALGVQLLLDQLLKEKEEFRGA